MSEIQQLLSDPSVSKVYLGNLPWKVTEEDLANFFLLAGSIVKCIIAKRGPRPSGYGFVAFSTVSEAEKACQMSSTVLMDRPIKVEMAILKSPEELAERKTVRDARGPSRGRGGRFRGRGGRPSESRPRPAGEPSETMIYVGNLPWAVNDEDLASIFKEYNVVKANIVRMQNGRSKGFGFVELGSKSDQEAILKELQHITVNSRQLAIKVATQTQVAPDVKA